MKKIVFLVVFIFFSFYSFCQNLDLSKKGLKIYVEEHEAKTFMLGELQDWGFYTVVANKEEADITVKLEIKKTGGGLIGSGTAKGSAFFIDTKNNTTLWFSKEVRGQSDLQNGYAPSFKLVCKKIVKQLKKKFDND